VRPLIRSSCIFILFLMGCNANTAAVVEGADVKPAGAQFIAEAAHSPPFARVPYEAFGRAEAVAIAVQEWRLFGERVDDDPPPPGGFDPAPGDDPARIPGRWERIGEYWWLGQDVDRRESAWTGMHDENGNEIDASRDEYYAWSAAFISYVMRTAGAGARFPYSPSHYVYINIAKEMKLGRTSGWVVVAERVDEYAPALGDLICYSREKYKLTSREAATAAVHRALRYHCCSGQGADQCHRWQRRSCRHNEACASYHRWSAGRRRRPSA
jgi:hypothetical protein